MLTADDVAWIRANRTEIKQHRTEPVTLIHVDGTEETVSVIFKEPRNPSGDAIRELADYSVSPNDYNVSFDPTVNVNTALKVIRHGRRYVLTDVDERGLGGLNRYECRALLVLSGAQSIRVTPGSAEDGWGAPTYPSAPYDLPAYVVSEINTTTNAVGEEAVTQLRIVVEGLANINERDMVRYVDELGRVTERRPVHIAVKRRADGTPLVTEVYI